MLPCDCSRLLSVLAGCSPCWGWRRGSARCGAARHGAHAAEPWPLPCVQRAAAKHTLALASLSAAARTHLASWRQSATKRQRACRACRSRARHTRGACSGRAPQHRASEISMLRIGPKLQVHARPERCCARSKARQEKGWRERGSRTPRGAKCTQTAFLRQVVRRCLRAEVAAGRARRVRGQKPLLRQNLRLLRRPGRCRPGGSGRAHATGRSDLGRLRRLHGSSAGWRAGSAELRGQSLSAIRSAAPAPRVRRGVWRAEMPCAGDVQRGV
jgi:hypothetical protein